MYFTFTYVIEYDEEKFKQLFDCINGNKKYEFTSIEDTISLIRMRFEKLHVKEEEDFVVLEYNAKKIEVGDLILASQYLSVANTAKSLFALLRIDFNDLSFYLQK